MKVPAAKPVRFGGGMMVRVAWINKVATFAATATIAYGSIIFSSVARADYAYNFTYTPTTGSMIGATGSLLFSNDPLSGPSSISSGLISFTFGGKMYDNNVSNDISSLSAQGHLSIFGTGTNYTQPFYNVYVDASRQSNELKGTATVSGGSDGTHIYFQSTGIFDAVLSSGGGGGGSGSGGAPTPELNAGLGILLAGASFAFLRRKRSIRHEATAA